LGEVNRKLKKRSYPGIAMATGTIADDFELLTADGF